MSEIKETSKDVVESWTSFGTERPPQSESLSPLAERIQGEPEFWIQWYRQPALDVAESVLRLRQLRGMTQEDLATAMGTKQPAIARIESGRNSISTNTMERLAEALDAAVRVQLGPIENLWKELPSPSWWEAAPTVEITQEVMVLAVGTQTVKLTGTAAGHFTLDSNSQMDFALDSANTTSIPLSASGVLRVGGDGNADSR